MANSRIKDLTETTGLNNDDYLVVDGTTSGTRKILALNVGGNGAIYDFTSTYTPSVDARGTMAQYYTITPINAEDVTIEKGMEIKAYLKNSDTAFYPLIPVSIQIPSESTYFVIAWKSIYNSTQSTTSSTITGVFHVVAPFEIQSVRSWM